jgi:hypothetical protein
MGSTSKDLESFIEQWQDSSEQNRKGFLDLKGVVESLNDVILDFIPREGVTYSLRAKHLNQKEKSLFVMVDVIEGEPRWLSVCFYAEMITDPDEKGDFVPKGLLGEDAFCFDLDEYNDESFRYVKQRIEEAYNSAAA